MDDRFLSERLQKDYIYDLYEYFRATGAHEMKLVLIVQISSVSLEMATIDRILIPYGMKFLLTTIEVPNDKILESLCKMRVRRSDQLQTVLAFYEQEIHQDRTKPSYQKLKTMEKRQKDQKIRIRNFQARNE